jgi:hypothetical protein
MLQTFRTATLILLIPGMETGQSKKSSLSANSHTAVDVVRSLWFRRLAPLTSRICGPCSSPRG